MARTSAKAKKAASTRTPRPVVCPICSSVISRKNDLNRHMQTHNKDKSTYPFACSYPDCEFRSLQVSNYKTHMKTHTGVKDQICTYPQCTFRTSDPGSLTRHRKRKHKYVPRSRRKWCEETNNFVESSSSSVGSPSTSRAPSEEAALACTPHSLGTTPQRSPSPSLSEPAYPYTPPYVASPIMRVASFDETALPRAATAPSRPNDAANITLPSISAWYPDEDEPPVSSYDQHAGYLPATVSCSGCPECDRVYATSRSAGYYPTAMNMVGPL
ncbi:hypothetical protein V5O48_000993 [Marasmius crinis-equi]|uniref:C2H2-type domain-containing protein n=1 Tax=Marasmius crinis-equi TaxID=585013 RepID=A0ABR3G051_9AGAR